MDFEIVYSEQFQEDIEAHKKAGQKAILKKIGTLIDELRKHPYIGTGNPEALKGNRKGQWSRRITQKHRLIYEVSEQHVLVILLAAYGHYDDK
ncbi:Txe/YoeB family addiction module toxin [Bacteroides sp. 519]|nr:Txe/YoeB family addiction module toxin [Bacteroides sp. 519]